MAPTDDIPISDAAIVAADINDIGFVFICLLSFCIFSLMILRDDNDDDDDDDDDDILFLFEFGKACIVKQYAHISITIKQNLLIYVIFDTNGDGDDTIGKDITNLNIKRRYYCFVLVTP